MFDTIIRILAQALIFIIFIDVLVSWLLRPDHPVRSFMDNLVNPLLDPIRNFLPQNIGIDISPIILMILIEIVQVLLISIF